MKAAGPLARVMRDRVVMLLISARFAHNTRHPDAWIYDHHIPWGTTDPA